MRPVGIGARTLTLGLSVALLASACGGSGGDGDDAGDALDGEVITLGDGVSLDDTEIVTTTTSRLSSDAAGGAGEGNGAEDGTGLDATTQDTVPQNEEEAGDPQSLFSAMRIFNECLSDEGTAFIGIPDDTLEADDPVNDPEYLDALQKCAGISNIQQAFADFQQANSNMNQEEIEERNRGLVVWADCMRGRGWTIDDLVPDDSGLLQPEGLTPPEGESLLGSDDMSECASTAQAEVEADDSDADRADDGS